MFAVAKYGARVLFSTKMMKKKKKTKRSEWNVHPGHILVPCTEVPYTLQEPLAAYGHRKWQVAVVAPPGCLIISAPRIHVGFVVSFVCASLKNQLKLLLELILKMSLLHL